ncbi:head-tail adaptor protein [Rubellimicrobium roseum]|uniref:Head-tail adaptor protein n=1 Tax=Rubellimicrobium roseum TaxID=687525 RepID=A0A5C4NL56_9RHOB|nr:head-tail adaptor protein [Rubellimicrobium roseum]TNC73407.1 head-tail adaptor protein [Rubellimicrobium roseum]
MSAPRLNRRLVLEHPTRTPDGAGGYHKGWTALGTLWAEVDPGTASTVAQPAGAETRLPLKITVRGAPLGAPSRPLVGQRFRDGANAYPIRSVSLADATGRFLLCLATEEGAL